MTDRHETLVRRQFGSTSEAYVSSTVHALGEDLTAIAARAAAIRPECALDLGTGGGHVAYAMAPYARRVTACDLSVEMLAAVHAEATSRAINNIATNEAAAEALPFADDAFDFLACRFSTHHWRDPHGGLREARRVLASDAPALFADVIAPPSPAADTHLQAVELLRDPSHVRDHSVAQWLAMLELAGFTATSVVTSRLRMDFTEWTARMRTPPERIAAIRALQSIASSDVSRHFAIEPDGSFTIDTVLIEAH
ncbi:class I SAM-dependent methyltransferase [Novosphingobium sp.]|uniref:class I SAM-dependent methyltransferase n=1 Tax=Novosphingobium sp. TaxID=1874826 RepID=UPI002FDA385C